MLPTPVGGKVFFGPSTGARAGRPPSNPWKLFLLIEGAGLRIKLVGDVTVSEDGQVSNVFMNQPELPFAKLDAAASRAATRAVLMNPTTAGRTTARRALTGWNGKEPDAEHAVDRRRPAARRRAAVQPDRRRRHRDPEAGRRQLGLAHRDQRGPDGDQNIKNLKLSLPAGAVGSLAAVPQCPLADAHAGNCPADTKVGTIKNTVGTGNGLLTAWAALYLGEAIQPGDAASIVIDVPARSGPIDLGDVVLINRVSCASPTPASTSSPSDMPEVFEGVPLPMRKIEITVDRPGSS